MSKSNEGLLAAKRAAKDEFYTQLSDIEKEVFNYRKHFKDKHIFLNCDDPEESEFWQHFAMNFDAYGLKQLTSTHFDNEKPTYRLDIIREDNDDDWVEEKKVIKTRLHQNGDFRSPEAVEILKQADIVVTNPPFSLFREYIAQLMEYDKKFLVMGRMMNAVNNKNIFPYVMNNEIWLGINSNKALEFRMPDNYELSGKTARVDEHGKKFVKVPGIAWFTNLEHGKRNEELILFRKYDPQYYPKYDNYDIIEVDKVLNIPADYDGIMGVPISFLTVFNPSQFEILGMCNDKYYRGNIECYSIINGKSKFARLLIRRKK